MRGVGAAHRRSSARGKKERHAPGFSSPGHSNSGRRLLRLCPCDARGAFPFHGSSGNGSSREREATRAPRQRRSWPLHALSSRAALAPPGCFGHEWLPGVAAAAPTIDAARLQRFHGCGWRRIRSKARHHRRMARGGQPALRAPRGVRGFLRRVHSPPGVASVLTVGGVRRTLESSLGISPGRGISISRHLHLEASPSRGIGPISPGRGVVGPFRRHAAQRASRQVRGVLGHLLMRREVRGHPSDRCSRSSLSSVTSRSRHGAEPERCARHGSRARSGRGGGLLCRFASGLTPARLFFSARGREDRPSGPEVAPEHGGLINERRSRRPATAASLEN